MKDIVTVCPSAHLPVQTVTKGNYHFTQFFIRLGLSFFINMELLSWMCQHIVSGLCELKKIIFEE